MGMLKELIQTAEAGISDLDACTCKPAGRVQQTMGEGDLFDHGGWTKGATRKDSDVETPNAILKRKLPRHVATRHYTSPLVNGLDLVDTGTRSGPEVVDSVLP
jgi:hypothetical protein